MFLFNQVKSQSDSYFETSKTLEIFTDLYKELDVFYVDDINSGDLMKKYNRRNVKFFRSLHNLHSGIRY